LLTLEHKQPFQATTDLATKLLLICLNSILLRYYFVNITKPVLQRFRMQNSLTISEIKSKIERFCAYQERCHSEVVSKLRNFGLKSSEIDEVMVYLIDGNFINEERFARTFARGKHRIKGWGISRIVAELKARNISGYNITAALTEIDANDYQTAFDHIAERHWQSLTEKHPIKKRKKFCDFLLRKGYDADQVYAKAKSLEKSQS